MATSKTSNILNLVVEDRGTIVNLINNIETNSNFEAMYGAFNEAYKQLMLHAKAKQIVLYSPVREYSEAKPYIDGAEKDLQAVAALLEQAKESKPGSDEFMTKLAEIRTKFEKHCEQEEREVFEIARDRIGEKTLTDLAQEFEQTKAKLQPSVIAALSA